MAIDFDDFEYAIPGEHLRTVSAHRRVCSGYDLRTGPELAAQQRIAALESRLRHVERMLHLAINDADESAVGV